MALSRFCFLIKRQSELAAVTYLDQTSIIEAVSLSIKQKGRLPLFQESQTVNQETAALEKKR